VPPAAAKLPLSAIGRPDSRPHLVAIACPTLVVVGDDDQFTPPDLAREMASAIPRARLAVIAECDICPRSNCRRR
jgi:pimeloyl-ACP methyl ester carboxylesterase